MLKGLAWMSAFISTASNRQDSKRDEQGAAFTEYVVLLSLIVAIIVGALTVLEGPLDAAIDGVVQALGGGAPAAP